MRRNRRLVKGALTFRNLPSRQIQPELPPLITVFVYFIERFALVL